ncbi:hypothetical protein BH11PSE9_BH11PSE9_20440 [soil metagenome]
MRKSILSMMAWLLWFAWLAPAAHAADARLDAKTGVVVTPRNFPNHTGADVDDMFRLAADVGSFAVIRVNWNDADRLQSARALIRLGEQRGLASVVELSPFKADGLKSAAWDPPKDVASAAGGRPSLANPAFADAFSRAVLELAELKPPYLAVATDVNLFAAGDAQGAAALAGLYKKLAAQIAQISPKTQVFATFQWDAMQSRSAAENRSLVDAFRSSGGLVGFTSEPRKLFEKQGPGGIPGDYYAKISEYRLEGRNVFVEVNWPSDGRNGEADQVSFIQRLPALMASLNPSLLAWTFLHDVKVLVFTIRAGLLSADGKPKPALAAFRDLGSGRQVAAAPKEAPPPTSQPRAKPEPASRAPALFGVYTARLDGSDVQTIVTSPDHEMTHPRISPDGKKIVITRYNARDKHGKATEDTGYEETEIMVLDMDGGGLETIVPPKPGVMSANGCWTPDGKALIYISTDNAARAPEIRQIDLATRKVTRVPTPSGLKTTDPHWEGDQIVFPAKGDGADAVWLMKADGSGAKQITKPPKQRSMLLGGGLSGDFDPKLAPDGSKVAFMRIAGGDNWRVMMLDLKSGEERELTPKGGVIEGLPTWSSDGRLLLFRHIDRSKPREIGLYTMTPDGGDRKMVPLPRGYLYNHGTFFPGEGSSPSAHIIYTGTQNAGMR